MSGSNKRKRRSTMEDPQEAFVSKLVDRALAKKTKEMYQLKGVDVQTGGRSASSDLTVSTSSHHLNPVRPGDALVNRGDNSVKMQSLRVKIPLEWRYSHDLITGVIHGNVVRCVLVQIKNPGSTIPAWNDIIKLTLDNNTLQDSFYSGIKLGSSNMYRILRDDIVEFTPTTENTLGHAVIGTGSATVNIHKELEWFIPLRDMEARWDPQNSDGQYAGMTKNALVLYVRARNNTTHSYVYWGADARLRFVDT